MTQKINFTLNYIFLLIIFNILFLFLLIKILPNQTKIDIRFALFSKKVNRNQFLLKKNNLIRYVHDSSYSNNYNKYKFRKSNTLLTILSKFNRFNYNRECGKFSRNLNINIDFVLNGQGCCSDFSQVFIALCNINNYPVCEINNLNHTFNEIYDDKTQKYIWIDLDNKVIAKDKLGNFLSTIEIHDNLLNNDIVQLSTFKNTNNIYNTKKISFPDNFSKEFYKSLILTNHKNVLEYDTKYSKYNFIPIELQQFIFAVYNYPLFLVLDDSNTFWNKILKIRFYIISSICFLLFINYLLYKKLRNKN
jgi:hypothetical protein